MKRIYIILLLLFIIFENNIAQPVISYITPDIGAPGMAIYVEFIGPHDKIGNFGIDGVYLNNSQKTEIILADNSDKNKVKVGPIVVSWQGRMLSTILYVNDELDPNNFDAKSVSPNFQIELQVRLNDKLSNSQTFYIVKSRPYLDLSQSTFSGDSIFGSNNLGKRSPRGAMIYDSIKLGPRKYWVSTDDTDNDIAGNQGLLPFTFLVKGKISGTPGLSKITVNGGEVLENGKPNGMVQDAAPGGGGGGGSFKDFSDMGFRGGNGFTGGGPGGRNKSGNPFTNDDYTKPPSVGSGPYLAANDKQGGYSLNGVGGPILAAYEAAGGGTGHPFGRSGEGCGDGANCEPVGGAGGGSGWKQNSPGGSGGYATEGSSSSANGINGGKITGNFMVVPIAGGSGAAGGNPNCFPPGQSAAGGAGGGAIRLFALEIEGVDFEAIGADGATNDCDESEGGSGSGGHVGLQAKLNINKTKINVDGGENNRSRGGAGRVRLDYPSALDINVSTASASNYKGPTTDTTHIIRSNHILTGTQDLGKTSHLYISKDDGDWNLLAILKDENWSYDLTSYLNKRNGIYYVAVATIVDNPEISDHTSEPHEVLSQAAANILKLDLRPFIDGDTNVSDTKIFCLGETITLSAKIQNKSIAEVTLDINLSDNNWLLGDNGFKIKGPVTEGVYSIAPGATAEILVDYTMPVGADPSQTASNILIIPSNDPDYPSGKDWKIQFKVDPAFIPELSYDDNSTSPIIIDTTKVGLFKDTSFVLVNSGNSDLYISKINPLANPFELITTEPALPVNLKIGEKLKINLRFSPSLSGDYSSILTVIAEKTDSTCALEQHTEIKSVAVATDIDVPTRIDLGLVPYCETRSFDIQVTNISNASFTIKMFPEFQGNDKDMFTVTSNQKNELVIGPGDGTKYVIQFTPDMSKTGPVYSRFYFTTDDPNFDTIFVDIYAEIVGFDVTANPSTINLGNVPVGFEISKSLTLLNSSKLDNTIGDVLSKSGFAYIDEIVDKNLAADNGTQEVNFTIKPLKKGIIDDSIIVIISEPCIDSLVVYFKGNALESNPTVYMDEDEIIIDTNNTTTIRETSFGDFSKCATQGLRKTVLYYNYSEAPYIVLNEELIEDAGGRYTIVASPIIFPDTINVNTNDPINGSVVEFDPVGAPVGTYDGKIRITLLINGIERQYTINLRATVYRGKFNIISSPLIMSGIVNTSSQFDLTIENVGPGFLEIINHIPPSLSNIFEITPNPDGITIENGSEFTFKINFKPIDLIDYRDSIIINSINSNCDSTFVIYLNGKGEPSKELIVYLPNLLTTPDQRNFKIPIFGKFKKDTDSLDNINLDMKLRFNRSLFFPDRIENGQIIQNNLDGRDRVLSLKFNNINISPTDSIIGYLEGTTLLGDSKATDLLISELSIVETELVSSVESNDGSLEIEICEEGGDRLLDHQLNTFSVEINPNPAKEIINVKIKTLEKGEHHVLINDVTGREIYKFNWFAELPGDEKITNINLSSLNSGIYLIKVFSPNDIRFSKINVVK